MCENKTCYLASKCYRQVAEPDSYRQSYAHFEPDDDGDCEWFMLAFQDIGPERNEEFDE